VTGKRVRRGAEGEGSGREPQGNDLPSESEAEED